MALDPIQLDMLARDPTPRGRGRLLGDLTRLVFGDRRRDDVELEIFFDIVRAILSSTACDDRRGFAETAADRDFVPHDLILVLAEDDISVAEPVLSRSPVLTDDDLVALTRDRGDDHRLAIASRSRLSQAVCRALVALGSATVVHRVGGNDGADLAAETIRDLQARATTDPDLRRILGERPDLSEILARSMIDTLRRIARSVPTDGDEPEESLSRRPRRMPARDTYPEVVRLLGRVSRGEIAATVVVGELAEADRVSDLACFLGAFADMEESRVMRVLVRADGTEIAALARGIDIDEEDFARVVGLRQRRLRFSLSQVRWEREHYRRLDPRAARNALLRGTVKRSA
jgi:hypothetical protein